MKLLSLKHGPAQLGYPFDKLFNEVVLYKDGMDIQKFNAIVFWGGEDISPTLYSQKPNAFCEATDMPSARDLLEWKLMKLAVGYGIPMIGVCRGAQLMCAFDGGSLAQDVGGHMSGHDIEFRDGQRIFAAASHHQMMLPRSNAQVLAWACHNQKPTFYLGENDTINTFVPTFKQPEIVYFPDIKGLGIQPHPEWMPSGEKFVEVCNNLVSDFLLTEKV